MQADESKVQLFWFLAFLLLISPLCPPPSGWITALCFEHTIMQHGGEEGFLKQPTIIPNPCFYFYSPPPPLCPLLLTYWYVCCDS